jgi:DNA-directed RNA polymerase subunit RPC12/RpoP
MAKRYTAEFANEVMLAMNMYPLEDFKNVTSNWRYKCLKCKNEGVTTLHKVKNHNNGCPYCGGVKVDPKVVAKRMKDAQLEPLEPYKSSTAKWKVRHLACGNIVTTTWHEVQSGQGGCGICRYTKIAKKLRTSDDEAEKFMREAGGEPLEPYKNSHARWKVRCIKCGATSYPILSNVRRGQGVCMACRPKSPVVTEASATKFIESKGLHPVSKYKTAQSKWKLKCRSCGKSDFYVYSWMKSQDYGCVYCSKHKVDPSDALKLFRKMGFQPLGPYVNAKKPIKAKCLNCNRISLKRYDDVRTGRGCKYCQTAALDLLAPTYYYIMKHEQLEAIKVGIGNVNRRQDRIKTHIREGWQLFYSFELDNGELALQLEQEVLSWLRQELHMPIYLSKKEMPQGGWTETVSADGITVLEIRAKFEEIFKQSFS